MRLSELEIQEKLDIIAMGCQHVEELIYPYYLGWSAEDYETYQLCLFPFELKFDKFTYLINIETSEIDKDGSIKCFTGGFVTETELKDEEIFTVDRVGYKSYHVAYTEQANIYFIYTCANKILYTVKIINDIEFLNIIKNNNHYNIIDTSDKILYIYDSEDPTADTIVKDVAIIDKATNSIEYIGNHSSAVLIDYLSGENLRLTYNHKEYNYEKDKYEIFS